MKVTSEFRVEGRGPPAAKHTTATLGTVQLRISPGPPQDWPTKDDVP